MKRSESKMKIGLVNLEPKIENTAYMQISQYHKQQGDTVEWYSPLFKYDRVYASSLFTFTDKSQVPRGAVTGGTGFNVRSRLQKEMENCNLDYSIYPKCKTSYVWFSRGCFRKCPFCVVPIKEGRLDGATPKNLNPKATTISVMDNNFTGLDKILFSNAIDYLKKVNLPVNFHCGLDARLLATEKYEEIKKLKIYKQIRTAWDDPREDLTYGLTEMAKVFGKSKVMVYVLIGYWSTPEEDLARVMKIRELGLDVWVMPFNKKDPYQKAFERWANRHAGCEWSEYHHGSWKTATSETKSSSNGGSN
jgi:hypothetical protein